MTTNLLRQFARSGQKRAGNYKGAVMAIKNSWVKFLRTLPLKELRGRQWVCEQQTEIAYQKNKTVALKRLVDMADSLTEAICLNEFPEGGKRWIK